MARKPTGKPTGRPPKEFNKQIFENLCQIQCTVNEVEAVLQSDQRTVDNWCKREYGEPFSTVYKRFAESGKPSLRRMQWNLAKTNASVSIWLGKQYLGQRDPEETKNHANVIVKVQHDGLGSGLNISAEAVPASNNKGSE